MGRKQDGKGPRYPLDRRMGRPVRRYGHSGIAQAKSAAMYERWRKLLATVKTSLKDKQNTSQEVLNIGTELSFSNELSWRRSHRDGNTAFVKNKPIFEKGNFVI